MVAPEPVGLVARFANGADGLLFVFVVPDDGIVCDALPDDFSISLSKSMMRSPMPPTSHSLSSYSKLVSFDSAADVFVFDLILLFKVLPLTLLVIDCLLLSVARLLMATFFFAKRNGFVDETKTKTC